MSTYKANVGRILLGEKELAGCEGIEVNYDFNPIKHYAADRQFPVFVSPGNSDLTITVDCAESSVEESYALETIGNDGDAVTVELRAGYRGGGIPATTITNCVITQYTVTSRQGDIVKARVMLSKQADT
jgi:hypothetical protein